MADLETGRTEGPNARRAEGDEHPFDNLIHATQARFTSYLSPESALLAYLDWALHLANSPDRQGELMREALLSGTTFAMHVARLGLLRDDEPCIAPQPRDHRFRDEGWKRFPFNACAQGFLLAEKWWHEATGAQRGVSKHHSDMVRFAARQILDAYSPSNFVLTNPEVLKKTLSSSGMNLVRGARNLFDDWQRAIRNEPPAGAENFQVGKQVAITPGKVVFRNRLIELIQYEPVSRSVHAEPVLIIPAWIMKYYILDLSPRNSMVRYLVGKGHTVFMISWKNPTEEDRDLGMQDYVDLGMDAAMEAVRAIVPGQPVHAVGYCLGGTLLALTGAAYGRDGKDWLKSLTLFAAQIDFTEAGEIMLFIDESQVAYLEDIMWDQGYLDTRQMVGAFQMLRSNDLIWSRVVHDYLMGERRPMIDLMAWNADATRMPYRMHSQYLRELFLNNAFAEGHFEVGGKPVSPTDIRAPIFTVGAERDHVAPWRSVFKVDLLTDTDVVFLLTSGGHNAGIISEPGHPRRHYRISARREGDPYIAPDEWFEKAEVHEGSWWPVWEKWLSDHSTPGAKPPAMGNRKAGYEVLADAPGTYVLED